MPTYRVTMVGSTEEAVTQETGWINLWDLAMDKREREKPQTWTRTCYTTSRWRQAGCH